MDNFNEIKQQWTSMDVERYPHLFDWTANKIEEGMKPEEKKKVN